MRFRPCIDLRNGRVVQIVGGSLKNDGRDGAHVNYQSDRSPAEFAEMYKSDNLPGGHVISLGEGNEEAALFALGAYPGGMHFGGGINPGNAKKFLDAGASHVIVTSYLFNEGEIDIDRLKAMIRIAGKKRLVVDLSCRKKRGEYIVVTDRWQRFSEFAVNEENLGWLSGYCDEFLIHGVDVEGKRAGIETGLVEILGESSPIPVTYAGGVKSLDELDRIKELGRGRVDITIGSALDIFGGSIPYKEVVEWQRREELLDR